MKFKRSVYMSVRMIACTCSFYRCISMLEAVMLNQIHGTDSIYFKIICTNKNIPQICQPVSPD